MKIKLLLFFLSLASFAQAQVKPGSDITFTEDTAGVRIYHSTRTPQLYLQKSGGSFMRAGTCYAFAVLTPLLSYAATDQRQLNGIIAVTSLFAVTGLVFTIQGGIHLQSAAECYQNQQIIQTRTGPVIAY